MTLISIIIEIYEKYIQNILKYFVKNTFLSDFFNFNLLDLIFYMQHMSEMHRNITFCKLISIFNLYAFRTLINFLISKCQGKTVKFPNIFGLKETRNLVQFLYACKVRQTDSQSDR